MNDNERARTYQIKIVWFNYTNISERRTRRRMVGWIMDWMMEEMGGMDSSRIWFRSQKRGRGGEGDEEEGRKNGIENYDAGKVVMSNDQKKERKENPKR